MPSYGKVKWGGYSVQLYAYYWDIPRILSIVPFFWETDINLDMVVKAPKKVWQVKGASLQYRWELFDSDDKPVRNGQDSCEVARGRVTKYRKLRAIKIGRLKPYQCYQLKITLTDSQGNTSEPMPIAYFTIKDKDELKTQILIVIISIIFGIVFGFVFGILLKGM